MSTARAARTIRDNSRQHFAHPDARVETEAIGPRTRIWAFAHVLEGARIGADCNICDHTFIEGGAEVGDRVTVKCGVQIWEGVTLEDDVFVGPNATFTNDAFPRSRRQPASYARTLVRRGASIGANATFFPGVTIGSEAMIGAGAVVTRDVPARAIVMGNPGYVTGYMDYEEKRPGPAGLDAKCQTPLVGGAMLYQLPRITDYRGDSVLRRVEPVAALSRVALFPGLRRAQPRDSRRACAPDARSVSGRRAWKLFGAPV